MSLNNYSRPGDRLDRVFTSTRINAWNRAADANLFGRSEVPYDSVRIDEEPANTITLQNDASASVDWGSVRAIQAPAILDAEGSEFRRRVIMTGGDPLFHSFCVSPNSGFESGGTGIMAADGIVSCRLFVPAFGAWITRADVDSTNSERLLATPNGSAQILWKDSGTDTEVDAIVRLSNGEHVELPVKTIGTVPAGGVGTVEVWQDVAGAMQPTGFQIANVKLDWMDSDEDIGNGMEALIAWFPSEQIWRFVGAECEQTGPGLGPDPPPNSMQFYDDGNFGGAPSVLYFEDIFELQITAQADNNTPLKIFPNSTSQAADQTQWHNDATGLVWARVNDRGNFSNTQQQTNSEAFGAFATVLGADAFAAGAAAEAGEDNIAIGPNTTSNSTGSGGIAIGKNVDLTGRSNMLLGNNGTNSADFTIMIGPSSSATVGDDFAVGIGVFAEVADESVAIGYNVGSGSPSNGRYVHLGYQAGTGATGEHTQLIGWNCGANTTAESSFAIGSQADPGDFEDVACLGREATATANSQVIFGSRGHPFTDFWLGQGVFADPEQTTTLHASDGRDDGVSNVPGSSLALTGGNAVANAVGGSNGGDLFLTGGALAGTGSRDGRIDLAYTGSVAQGIVRMYGAYQFPTSDGIAGETLVTDGLGQLTWGGTGGTPWIDLGNVSGTVVIDFAAARYYAMTLTGDVTLDINNVPDDRSRVGLEFTQDGTGGHTVDASDWDGITSFQHVLTPLRQGAGNVTFYEFYRSGARLMATVGTVSGTYESIWMYDGTGGGAPSSGNWRRTGGTALRIHRESQLGADTENLLSQLPIGSAIIISEIEDSKKGENWTSTGTPIDNGTWFQIPGTRTVWPDTIGSGKNTTLKFQFV